MKIISKNHDYYDCGVAYGVDDKIYFKRATQELGAKTSRYMEYQQPANKFEHSGFIAFCGKKYPFKLIVTSKTLMQAIEMNTDNSTFKYYFTSEEYLKDYPNYYANKKYRGPAKPLEEIFKITKIKDEVFIKRGVPYYIKTDMPNACEDSKESYTTEANLPILKNFNFNKIMDPMVAFQEISMYLGVMNAPTNECEIDEKYRIAGHGMDCTSFRNTTNKTKKCKQIKKNKD